MPSYSHEKRDVLPHLAQMHIDKCWPPLLYTTLSDAEKLRSARMAASSGANASAGAPVVVAGGDIIPAPPPPAGPFPFRQVNFSGGRRPDAGADTHRG